MARTIGVLPCLDVKDGRVVKGVQFKDLKDAGDPAELAGLYSAQGADEVALLDLAASNEGRSTMLTVVRAAAEVCTVPLTVGGGVGSLETVATLLENGASKVSISTAAVGRPEFLDEVANEFGSHVLLLSLDARRSGLDSNGDAQFEVTTHGGTHGTGRDAMSWAKEAEERGVGQILLNSIDQDGVKTGYDLELIRVARETLTVPLIASGGAGSVQHFVEGAKAGADVVLGASVFHFGTVTIAEVKAALNAAGFEVEPVR